MTTVRCGACGEGWLQLKWHDNQFLYNLCPHCGSETADLELSRINILIQKYVEPSKVAFAVQHPSRLSHDALTAQQIEAIKDLDIPYFMFGTIPHTTELTGWDNNFECVIPLGGTKIATMFAEGQMPPNAKMWYDSTKFDQQYYSAILGDEMFNANPEWTTFGQVCTRCMEYDAFIKPTSDIKTFAGTIVPAGHVLASYLSTRDVRLVDSTPVMVAPYQPPPISEYRCFVVDGCITEASKYMVGSKLAPTPLTDGEWRIVRTYFNRIKTKYEPAGVYVVDFAATSDDIKVMEYNCFHASGIYTADMHETYSSILQLLSTVDHK